MKRIPAPEISGAATSEKPEHKKSAALPAKRAERKMAKCTNISEVIIFIPEIVNAVHPYEKLRPPATKRRSIGTTSKNKSGNSRRDEDSGGDHPPHQISAPDGSSAESARSHSKTQTQKIIFYGGTKK